MFAVSIIFCTLGLWSCRDVVCWRGVGHDDSACQVYEAGGGLVIALVQWTGVEMAEDVARCLESNVEDTSAQGLGLTFREQIFQVLNTQSKSRLVGANSPGL